MSAWIEVSQLCKRYGQRLAVDGLTFSVGKGEIVGFLGPNGAGKSTTMRILSGYLAPSSGNVRVAGIDVQREPLRAKQHVGYMPEAVPLYPEMRVVEYLGFRAEAKEVPRAQRRARIAECIEKVGLREVANVPTAALSKGYKQRVGLADALLAKPKVLLLDEPTAGLDPNQIRQVRALLAELATEHTVLLSTHILSEVEACCSRAVVVRKGKLVAEGTLSEIFAQHAPRALWMRVYGAYDAVCKVARELCAEHESAAGDGDGAPAEHTLRVQLAAGASAAELDALAERCAHAAHQAQLALRELRRGAFGLEQVFAELTLSEAHER